MRGSVLDLAGIMFLVALMVISGFLAYTIYSKFKEKWVSHGASEFEQEILNKGTTTANILMNSIGIITISAGIGAIVLAFLIPSHPVFLPISILALLLFIILSTVFSNFLWEFLNSTFIVAIANQFPLIASIVKYLPYIIAVFGFVLIIVMYSKSGTYE